MGERRRMRRGDVVVGRKMWRGEKSRQRGKGGERRWEEEEEKEDGRWR